MAPAAVIVAAALMSSCSSDGSPAHETRAASVAAEYLAALPGPGHGWEHLTSEAQGAWGDAEAYERKAAAVDWDDFTVRVTEGLVCHDGTTCSVCLSVQGGIDSIPPFLLASERQEDGIALVDPALPCGNATMGVYLGPTPWEKSGVMVTP